MLPAKFRGFASRVGRLASRALALHKDGERDGATARTSSTAATSGNVTTARTAHTSRTFRRALFAMLVSAATIATMLIVPPVRNANAANVSWDYLGNGYISPNSVASWDVYRDFGVQPPDINTVTVNGKKTTTIKWDVLFNATSCRIKKIANPFIDCDEEAAEHTYGGRPDFYLILPAKLKDNTIKITRYRTRSDGRHPVKRDGKYSFITTYSWETRGENQSPGDFNGGSNETKLPGDKGYEGLWDNSISKCGMGSDNACEINTWRRAGKFGRILKSWEQDNGVDAVHWIISAEVEDGVNPYDLPFLAGWISLRGDKHKFTAWGPYDHDGDGIPDLEEFNYGLNPKNNDDIQFPRKSKEDAVYGEVTSVKPYINTGEWVGDSYNGDFKYYKDMPNHRGSTTSEVIPTDAGIEFTFKKNEFGNMEILPPGVTKASNPNNMKPGQAYINPKTGEVKYSPKSSDRGRTIHFDVQINYPDPKPNNCKMNNSIVKVKGVDIHVVSQASRYNPEYETLKNVEPTSSNAFTERPKSVRPNGKYWVKEGPLPEGTTFTLRQYKANGGKGSNIGEPVLSWSHIENEDKKTGRVHFKPGRKEAGLKGKTPVIVTYPDGSTSEDSDAANFNGGRGIVYASVEVNPLPIGDQDMHLNIHNGNNEYSPAGAPIGSRDSDILHYTNSMPIKPNLVLDSWSNVQPGKIVFRTLCSEDPTTNNKYTFLSNEKQEFNGLKIGKPVQWEKLGIYKKDCKGDKCNTKKYLYTDDSDTAERSRAVISGTPKNNGNFKCVVYALHEGSQILNNLDNLGKNHPEMLSLFANYTSKDIASRTFRFKVHPMAEMYNPKYETSTVQAGNFDKNNNVSKVPRSFRNANGVTNNPSYVKNNVPLPDGTWFEPAKPKDKLSKWASFEDGQDNKPANKNVGKNHNAGDGTKYGKVTFSPDKWQEADTYNYPVVVHYPDGSKSTDRESANGGKPVNAPVKVERKTANPDFHLNLYTGRTGGTRIVDNDSQGVTFKKNQSVDMLVDSWSTYKPGPIDQRVICYKYDSNTGQPIADSYQVGGINGLSLTGDSNSKPKQWQHADVEHNSDKRKTCNRNDKSGCETGTYLYDYDVKDGVNGNRETTERTNGHITGKPEGYGDFVCTVYGLKTLSHKGKTGGLVSRFDAFVKNIKNDASGTLSNINALLNNTVDAKYPQNNSVRHVDWDSVTFPIHVHSDAHYYNPKYEEVKKLQAGETGTSKLPKSVKNANGAKNNQDDVKDNEPLPDGTWFEFKQYTKNGKPNGDGPLNYAFFENDDDNVKNEGGKKSAKNGTGQFGNVTFHPHRWISTNRSDNAPVVVHYPDGSTSEDPDSGNNGNPVYAKVNVVPHDYNPGDLSFDVTNNFNNGGWADKTIKIKKGDPLTNSHPRRLNLWSTHKPGKIELRTICHKIIHKDNTADTTSEYTWNGIAGITMENPSIWDHQEDPQKQHKCYGDKKQCDVKLLYDDYVINGNSRNTTERTRASLVGKANESGDYECVVYAIKQGSKLLESFDNAVQSIKPDKSGKATPSNTDPLKGFKWKLDGDTGKKDAVKGVDYEYRAIQIQIHNDNHFYNPKYVDVNVTAGQKVENAVPQSVKSANGADKYQDAVRPGALPDGTWFEFKDAANGFEVNADGTKGNSVSLDWSYWASGNATDKTGEQSNKPDNPSKQKNGKHSSKDDGTRYGKVTFHPDQSVAPKAYFKEIVIHYPDGSTSDDPDSGNNGKPVYAKVTVGGFSGSDKDLKMTLLRSQDADPVDTLGGNNSLTVMSGTSLTKNPYVRAWSLKDRSNISLRMMCTKQGEQKWSHGLDDTLNMHLNQNYGEGVRPWAFANADQRKSCSENGDKCIANLLYGFTKNKDPNSIESAVSRSEDDIAGIPQKAGNYTCAVFALKPNALTVFNGLSSSTDMKKVQLTELKSAVDWNRISFDVNVIDPPKFALPKTGGEGMNMALLVLMIIGMCVMCGAFFVDQTKWGHTLLESLLRKALIKDFICKTAKKLRALRRLGERWRC
ncbi:Rib/alpha-like domain-containing protein [Gardnerella sp. KA00255]|uniref:Rib/alpha-like domain-containing protein n=1 Tax=Gardnerella sp. KA00255 TaxID=2749073 RepID=UPI003BA91034